MGTKNKKQQQQALAKREHTDQWRKLYDMVYEKLSQKQDPFVKSFEEMLGLSIYSKLGLENNVELEEL